MKKHFTTPQIWWIIAICLIVSLLTNIPDAIKGFKEGYAMKCTAATKK